MSTMNVLDAAGLTVAVEKPLVPGQALAANSRPVVIASDQSAVPISGTVTANVGTGTQPVSGTFWQTTQPVSIASSVAVTGTFFQATQPVSNAGTFAVQAAQSGTWNVTNISGTISLPTGASTATNQTTLNTAVGSTTDAAVANGSGGSLLGMIRSIKDSATDTTTPSPVKIDQTTDGTTNRVSAVVRNPSYETVAASQTDQVMGASGAAGDILAQVLIIPATTSPGAVSIKDGAGSAITIFTGGASSVTTLIPFAVPLGVVAGTAWKITTGANVSAIGIGKFS